jgi:hypothetical protein
MPPTRRLLTRSAFALLAVFSLAQGSSAADQTAANAGLLAKYVAAFNAHDPAALKEAVTENYMQHNGRTGQGLAGLQATVRQYFKPFLTFI